MDMYVRMHVYVCVYTYIHTSDYRSMCVCIHIYTHILMYGCVYINKMCVRVLHVDACIHIYLCLSLNVDCRLPYDKHLTT